MHLLGTSMAFLVCFTILLAKLVINPCCTIASLQNQHMHISCKKSLDKSFLGLHLCFCRDKYQIFLIYMLELKMHLVTNK